MNEGYGNHCYCNNVGLCDYGNRIGVVMEKIGYIMVDSGHLLLGDPSYLNFFRLQQFPESTGEQAEDTEFDNYSYNAIFDIENKAGILKSKYHVDTGSGAAAVVDVQTDGAFPVTVERDTHGRITSVKVVFV
jgi:hypothetical protein